jgi:hypothetical protein
LILREKLIKFYSRNRDDQTESFIKIVNDLFIDNEPWWDVIDGVVGMVAGAAIKWATGGTALPVFFFADKNK